ncbi:pyridoxal phosphate-dependent aminotransferase [Flavobacterium sp.]|jgi:histidinol-phosphate/aromatic aminotransferase/cobyric acid decarboxylase-like protein|uniref:pyridoxal phosphate-dependent aminotransferase n=1 Tax=Flavobacterium sp. TaxID=239 RepID=UPI0037BF2CB6
MINLSQQENQFLNKFNELKTLSGSHSPSIVTLMEEIGSNPIEVDACFLSNPYATELFIEFFEKELVATKKLHNIIESYPPQNQEIAQYLSKAIKIPSENIFIGNGAIEIIQAVIHNFLKGKIVVNIPTFSSYYEYVKNEEDVLFYQLSKENNYVIDIENYVKFIEENRPNTIVLINPNNPNGDYINKNNIKGLLDKIKFVENIILDESFIHFAYENLELSMVETYELLQEYPNLIIIKSMAKDFGIAGLRAGYGIMSAEKVSSLLKTGYLWNVSGLTDYFFKLYSRIDFQKRYDLVRKKYIMNTLMFINELNRIPNIKVYPSKANFALVELTDGSKARDVMIKLLFTYGVYVRECSDKIGLDGQFLRVASRSFEENIIILDALNNIYANNEE